MVPLTLTLKNFLSYGDQAKTLDFRNFHIACLSGGNGYGKSALIDALTWALWGKCRVKIKEEVIKRGARDARVELEFESEGSTYRIIRTIERKKRGTSSTVDIQVLDEETGNFRPLDEGGKSKGTIEEILKLDYNSFICSSFILQGMADEFTKRTPSERKEILSKILELDEYETLTKKAREQSQDASLDLNGLQNEENQITLELEGKQAFEKELKKDKLEGKELTRAVHGLDEEYKRASVEFEAHKVKIEELKKLRIEKEDRELTLGKLEHELMQLGSLIGEDRELVLREKEILKGFGRYEKALGQERLLTEKELLVSKLEKELQSAKNEISKEKAKLESKTSSLRSRAEEINKTIKSTLEILMREDVITTNYKKIKALQALEKKYEEKKRAQDKIEIRKSGHMRKIELERSELESQGRELNNRIEDAKKKTVNTGKLNGEIDNINTRIKEMRVLERKTEKLKERLKLMGEDKRASDSQKLELEKRKKEEESKLSVISGDTDTPHCPLCESPLQAQARAALIEKLEGAVSGLQEEINQSEKKIDGLVAEGRSMLREIKHNESRTNKLPALQKELGVKEQSLKEADSYSKQLKELHARIELLQKKLQDEDYSHDGKKALSELAREEKELGYDPKLHVRTRRDLEKLGKYESDYELLKKDKLIKESAEKEVLRIIKELTPLVKTLENESYAGESRKRIAELTRRIDNTGYSGDTHKKLKESLDGLKLFAVEKQMLDKAMLGLSLRKEEEKKLIERIEEGKKKLADTEKMIENLRGIESQTIEKKENMTSLSERISLLKKNKDELLIRITRTETELTRIEKLTLRKKEVQDRIKRVGYDLTIFRELVKAFGKNGLQALIIEHAVPEIEIEANKILSRLTEGTMALSLEMVKPTQKGGEKETLEIYIGDTSGTRSYETFSGGEAFRVDFALRVAISKFIANRSGAQLRTLVIDEGFGTQDRDGLNHFIQVINTIKDDFDKILAITHVDELKERFPVKIEVTKETGQGSSFEVVYS
jgi:DNA repair protein SbcC/Rad50